MKVKITLTEELLGTAAANPDIHDEFIASKAPDALSREQEVEALGVEEVVEKSMTVFPRENGNPILWDYQIKGFFKDACGILRRAIGQESGKITSYKKVIDGLIFVYPRAIPLALPDDGEIGECQRPLRADTAKGERIALAHSETVPPGTTIEIEIEIYELTEKKGGPDLKKCVVEWLDYGKKRGLGQWRNSGKGRFTWELVE